MKLLLIQAARIRHNAGEVVEASPAEAAFLLSVGAAVPHQEQREDQPKPVKAGKKGK